MNNSDVLENIKKLFVNFYGEKYIPLIDERLSNLVDIIYYDNLIIKNKSLSDINSYLGYYKINDYRLEIISNNIPFNKYILDNGIQGTIMFLSDNRLRNVIYFPNSLRGKDYCYDITLVHELLHVLEEHLIIQEDDYVISLGGFDTTTVKGIDSDETTHYEYMNEILHHFVAVKILERGINNDLRLFNTKEEVFKSINEYNKECNDVIKAFFKKYESCIYDVMINGNTVDFIEKVGVDSFEDFNNWIKDFYSKYDNELIRRNLNCHPSDEYNELIEIGLNIVNSLNSYF